MPFGGGEANLHLEENILGVAWGWKLLERKGDQRALIPEDFFKKNVSPTPEIHTEEDLSLRPLRFPTEIPGLRFRPLRFRLAHFDP